METINDVAIIGAGPAGVSAAIYLARVGYRPLLLEKNRVGGLLVNANLVENYPGFPEGISGSALVELFKAQLARWGIATTRTDVKKVTPEGELCRLNTTSGDILARFVIVASGTRAKSIDLAGQDGLIGDKIFYEVSEIPHGWRDRRFLIIGGGDAAFDYALNLASNAGIVEVVFRGKRPNCLPLLEKRARAEDRITIRPMIQPLNAIEKDGKIQLNCISEGVELSLEGDYLLIACGREPNLDMVPSQIAHDVFNHGDENDSNIYIVGDVRRDHHRQVGIAVGDGIAAAMDVVERLTEEEIYGDDW